MEKQLEIIFEEEEWRDIPNYKGLYQVSNMGNVRSMNYNHTGKERILKPRTKKSGYLFVALCKDSKVKQYYLHRLVAQAFVPNDDPENKTEVNHIDESVNNNKASNLNWMTPKENSNWGTGIERSRKKRSKPVKQLTLNGALVTIWPSTIEAGRNGFSQGAVCACCNGQYETYKGFRWVYA